MLSGMKTKVTTPATISCRRPRHGKSPALAPDARDALVTIPSPSQGVVDPGDQGQEEGPEHQQDEEEQEPSHREEAEHGFASAVNQRVNQGAARRVPRGERVGPPLTVAVTVPQRGCPGRGPRPRFPPPAA